jgi:ADP-ribose pyrophosphatase YjhB (NUDIX family)
MAESQDPSTDPVKELLLADHAHFSSVMVSSEQSGETRVNWFIGIVTATTGALLALLIKQGEEQQTPLDPAVTFAIVFAALCGLLTFGIITLMRMMLRNSSTDRQKRALDEIRQMVQDYLDPQHLLVHYYPFEVEKKKDDKPKAYKSEWDEYWRTLLGRKKLRKLRKLGGLAHTVAIINSFLIAALIGLLIFAMLRVLGMQQLPEPNWWPLILWSSGLLLVFVAAFAVQWLLIGYGEFKAHKKLYAADCTHAGGVVWKKDGDTKKYLIVPSNSGDKWVLPKGKIEPGESHQQAALREVSEEAGVKARIVSLLDRVEFKDDGGKIVRVKFYLMDVIAEGGQAERIPHWEAFGTSKLAGVPESQYILDLAEKVVMKDERKSYE